MRELNIVILISYKSVYHSGEPANVPQLERSALHLKSELSPLLSCQDTEMRQSGTLFL